MSGGAMLVLVGLWVLVQITKGDLLVRTGIVPG